MKRPFEKRDFVAIGVGMVLLVVSMTVTIQWGDFIIRLCEVRNMGKREEIREKVEETLKVWWTLLISELAGFGA